MLGAFARYVRTGNELMLNRNIFEETHKQHFFAKPWQDFWYLEFRINCIFLEIRKRILTSYEDSNENFDLEVNYPSSQAYWISQKIPEARFFRQVKMYV